MAQIQTVLGTDTFKTWRLITNDLINVFNMPTTGTVVTLGTRVETFNITESAGVHIGCTVSDNGDGTIALTSGEALLRESNSLSAPIRSVGFAAVASLALTDQTTNFVYADYNSGTPQIVATTIKSDVNDRDRAMIAIVQKNGVKLTILQIAGESGDFERRITHRLRDTDGFKRATGAQIGEPSPLRFSITGGEFYYGVGEYLTPSQSTVLDQSGTATAASTTTQIIDSASRDLVVLGISVGDDVWDITNGQHAKVASFATTTSTNDTMVLDRTLGTSTASASWETTTASFEYYYNDGTWKENAGYKFDNTQYNNFGVGLAAMTATYYKTDWLYLKIGSNKTTLYTIYGDAEYATQAEAATATPPQNLPSPLDYLGVLIGRVIVQQGNANIVSLESVLNAQNFASSGATTFSDNAFQIYNDVDVSKKASFDVSPVDTGTERILKIPNKHGTIAVLDDIEKQHDEPKLFSSMGALSRRVIPYNMTVVYGTFEDDTSIVVNGQTVLSGLPDDSVGEMVLSAGDIVSSNKPIALKDKLDGNVVPALIAAAEHFWFYSDRSAPHEVTIYAPEQDIDVIYSTDTNFAVSENVWDPAVSGGGETNVIHVPKGKTKSVFVQYDPASTPGVSPPSANASEIGHHYFHSNGPMVISKEGAAADNMCVYPMSREILIPWSGLAAEQAVSFTGLTPTHVGNGYYVCDDVMQAFANDDGVGSSGHTGIPYTMCGDSYMFEHDIAGFQILAIEPCDIRVFCADNLYADIDLTAASRTNPVYHAVGNNASGAPSVASLFPTVGYVDFDTSTATGTFVDDETITQAVTGATAVIKEVYPNRLVLTSISGSFDTVNVVTGGTSGATCTLTKAPYRMWKFYGTKPFALRTNDPNDMEYIQLGYRKSLRQDAFDNTAQLDKNIHLQEDFIHERADWITNFDDDMDFKWDNVSGSGAVSYPRSPTVAGSSAWGVREVTGYRADVYKTKIPFNPHQLYKVTARVRATALDSAGQAVIYMGFAGWDRDYNYCNTAGANSPANQYYVLANGRDLATDGLNTWVELVAYFKGYGAYVPNATDPEAPSGVHDNVKFFRPFMHVNYPTGGDGSGTIQLDYFKIEDADYIERDIVEANTRSANDTTLQSNIDTVVSDLAAHDVPANHQILLTTEGAVNGEAIFATGDWNNYVNTGFYRGNDLLNAPALAGAHWWRFVTVIRHSSTYVIQKMTDFNNAASWSRVLLAGVWQAWVRIDANAIGGSQIAANSIGASHIIDGSIGTAELGAGVVGAANIADLNVTSAKIANGAVVTNKIAAGAITTDKISGPVSGTAYNLLYYGPDYRKNTAIAWQTVATWYYAGSNGQVQARCYQAFQQASTTYTRLLHNGVNVAQVTNTTGWSAWAVRDVANGDSFQLQAYGYGPYYNYTYNTTSYYHCYAQVACSGPVGYSVS